MSKNLNKEVCNENNEQLHNVILVLCFANTAQLFAGPSHREEMRVFFDEFKIDGEKVYVNPQQLLITEEGIYVQGQEAYAIVNQVNCDFNGVYFLVSNIRCDAFKCPKGHNIWCSRCRGCDGWGCPYACKCRDKR